MRQQVTQQCGFSGIKRFFVRILVGINFFQSLAFDKAHKIKFAVIDRSFSIDYLFYHRTFIHVFNKLG